MVCWCVFYRCHLFERGISLFLMFSLTFKSLTVFIMSSFTIFTTNNFYHFCAKNKIKKRDSRIFLKCFVQESRVIRTQILSSKWMTLIKKFQNRFLLGGVDALYTYKKGSRLPKKKRDLNFLINVLYFEDIIDIPKVYWCLKRL